MIVVDSTCAYPWAAPPTVASTCVRWLSDRFEAMKVVRPRDLVLVRTKKILYVPKLQAVWRHTLRKEWRCSNESYRHLQIPMDTVSKEISIYIYWGPTRRVAYIEYGQFWYNAICSRVLVRPRLIGNHEIKTGSDQKKKKIGPSSKLMSSYRSLKSPNSQHANMKVRVIQPAFIYSSRYSHFELKKQTWQQKWLATISWQNYST